MLKVMDAELVSALTVQLFRKLITKPTPPTKMNFGIPPRYLSSHLIAFLEMIHDCAISHDLIMENNPGDKLVI